MRHARHAKHEHQDDNPARQEGQGGRHGVLTDQPPVGLPHLRPRRRVRAPGPVLDLRIRSLTIHRVQTRGGG